MALKKFSSFDQARRDQWEISPGQDYYRRLRNFYRFIFRLHPPQHPRGIFRFRKIDEKRKDSAAKKCSKKKKGFETT